jgi:hypothetical protein
MTRKRVMLLQVLLSAKESTTVCILGMLYI